jgi:hypothetical protein
VDLSPPRIWSTFRGDGFTVQMPSTWRVLGNQTTAMIAPEGGIAKTSDGKLGNLVYGVLTDVYTPPADTPRDQAFKAMLNELNRENPGMQPESISTIRVAGRKAQTVQSISPNANNGRGEHDWIVGIAAKTSLRYFVFVSPQPDFKTLQPTFEHILKSIQVK